MALLGPLCGSAPTPSRLAGAALVLAEERATTVEHDGAVPPAWAEGYARLDPDRPPADVPLGRWQRFVDDVGQFIDSPFCGAATALGWTAHDLFGCDRQRPFARIDRAGLLWLLNGDKLVMLTADRATIETQNGNRLTYYRKPGDRRVVPWELDESFNKPPELQPVPF